MKKRTVKGSGPAKTYRPAMDISKPAVSSAKAAAPAVIGAAIQRLAQGTRVIGPTAAHGHIPKKGYRLQFKAYKTGSEPRHEGYVVFAFTSALDRINAVRAGVPSRVVPKLAHDLGVEQGYLIDRLGMARSTVARKVQANGMLSPHESERALGLAQIVGMVEAMTNESGAPAGFEPAAWVGEWIKRPQPALGGMLPADLLDTAEGLQLVMQLLQQAQSGAYA